MEKEIVRLNCSRGRYSSRREVIYGVIESTKEHPDADAVYAAVKKKLPDIGMATVYRNLKQLVTSGRVHTLETTKDCVHYDADISPHAHFICEKCGRITDLPPCAEIAEKIEEMGYVVKREKAVCYGVCPECNRNR